MSLRSARGDTCMIGKTFYDLSISRFVTVDTYHYFYTKNLAHTCFCSSANQKFANSWAHSTTPNFLGVQDPKLQICKFLRKKEVFLIQIHIGVPLTFNLFFTFVSILQTTKCLVILCQKYPESQKLSLNLNESILKSANCQKIYSPQTSNPQTATFQKVRKSPKKIISKFADL